jgi:hypothetical protein
VESIGRIAIDKFDPNAHDQIVDTLMARLGRRRPDLELIDGAIIHAPGTATCLVVFVDPIQSEAPRLLIGQRSWPLDDREPMFAGGVPLDRPRREDRLLEVVEAIFGRSPSAPSCA